MTDSRGGGARDRRFRAAGNHAVNVCTHVQIFALCAAAAVCGVGVQAGASAEPGEFVAVGVGAHLAQHRPGIGADPSGLGADGLSGGLGAGGLLLGGGLSLAETGSLLTASPTLA